MKNIKRLMSFQGLSNDSTLMQIQSGRTVPIWIQIHSSISLEPDPNSLSMPPYRYFICRSLLCVKVRHYVKYEDNPSSKTNQNKHCCCVPKNFPPSLFSSRLQHVYCTSISDHCTMYILFNCVLYKCFSLGLCLH